MPEKRSIENLWGILKGQVYENSWQVKNLNHTLVINVLNYYFVFVNHQFMSIIKKFKLLQIFLVIYLINLWIHSKKCRYKYFMTKLAIFLIHNRIYFHLSWFSKLLNYGRKFLLLEQVFFINYLLKPYSIECKH